MDGKLACDMDISLRKNIIIVWSKNFEFLSLTGIALKIVNIIY